MKTINPYRAPIAIGSEKDLTRKKSNEVTWMLVSAAIAAMIPLMFGIDQIYAFNQAVASLPENHAVCGNYLIGVYFCILVGTPIFAIIGSGLGWLLSVVWNSLQ